MLEGGRMHSRLRLCCVGRSATFKPTQQPNTHSLCLRTSPHLTSPVLVKSHPRYTAHTAHHLHITLCLTLHPDCLSQRHCPCPCRPRSSCSMQAPVLVLSQPVTAAAAAAHLLCVTAIRSRLSASPLCLSAHASSAHPLPSTADANAKRETGRKAQYGNIAAAKVHAAHSSAQHTHHMHLTHQPQHSSPHPLPCPRAVLLCRA